MTHQVIDDRSGQRSARIGCVEHIVEGLRRLGPDRSVAAVMKVTTASAVAGLAAASDASLTLLVGDQVVTKAPTSQVPATVDGLQYLYGGPCVDAALGDQQFVHSEDIRSEHRWPAFTAAALAGSPILSILSYRLWVGKDDAIGSLNLYADKPHAFDPDTVADLQHLAAYAAVLLAYAHERDKTLNLQRALDSNREIGAAVGILMARRRLSDEQAFDLLRSISQHRHLKLRDSRRARHPHRRPAERRT